MAHRLVVALTTLLGLTAATVVGSYLFLFAGTADRAASFAPPDSVAYLNVYLEPSAVFACLCSTRSANGV